MWTAGLLLMAMFALLPLRVALDMSNLERIGFTARQVAGTIWYGRIGDLQLRSQPLGTFEVKLDPAGLLLGNLSMRMHRMDGPDGPLSGRLITGRRYGVTGANGRLAVAAMLAPLPIEALELKDVSLLFRKGYCVESGGSVTPHIGSSVPGLSFDAAATAALRCEGKRARISMRSTSGSESFELHIDADGNYRGWIRIAGVAAQANPALSLMGFRPSPGGLVLSTSGRL